MKLTNQEVIKKADTFEDLLCTSSLKKFATCLEQLLKCKGFATTSVSGTMKSAKKAKISLTDLQRKNQNTFPGILGM